MVADRLGDLLRVDQPFAGRAFGKIVERLARSGVMLLCLGKMRVVALLVEQRKQRRQRRAHVADHAEIDSGAAPDVLRPQIDLRDADTVSLRIELTIGEVGPEHQQHVAVPHGVIAGREANEPGHPDVVGVVPLDVLLAAQRMNHGCLETLAQRYELVVRALAARAAQNGDAVVAVEQRSKPIEIAPRWRDHRRAWQQPIWVWRRRVRSGLQGNIARDHNNRRAAVADRFADSNLEHARHLMGRRDELAIMAALLKQRLRVGLLKIAAADLWRRDVRGNGEHGHARTVTIKQAVDEMQIAWAAASCADGELSGQMRLGAGGKGGDLLVPHMQPLDLSLTADSIREPVEAVANDAVDALDAGGGESFDELVCNSFHRPSSSEFNLRGRVLLEGRHRYGH